MFRRLACGWLCPTYEGQLGQLVLSCKLVQDHRPLVVACEGDNLRIGEFPHTDTLRGLKDEDIGTHLYTQGLKACLSLFCLL